MSRESERNNSAHNYYERKRMRNKLILVFERKERIHFVNVFFFCIKMSSP